MSEEEFQAHGMRPAARAYRCALWAAESLAGRLRLTLMLCEEIMLLSQQVSYLNHSLPEWELPNLEVESMSEALDAGLDLCNRMELLKTYIRDLSPDVIPWRARNPDEVWSQSEREPEQMILASASLQD
ncbi:hypothetical protein [Cerasicoccus arenae]|uniref:Uncharacterized protein n=1 Tax=Cerasicoccus arenae TaxID=424488 RepID=A0A8J3DIQ7_9BACT|nr:hypothetical protein [Cerasicoccus arenae]MBK1860019.1 hypothetical protein [Cerasicoccus arenae]GHC12605.1 hypothetical protein GCM10007047_32470 [Cerasicoccus arenae]